MKFMKLKELQNLITFSVHDFDIFHMKCLKYLYIILILQTELL
jgi:hypothetical protein